jgi:hypothetical protein
MRLSELNARFIGAGGEGIYQADGSWAPLRYGIGVMLNCPCGCESQLFVPFANPLDGGAPLHRVTWKRTGETIETLTLEPSILRRLTCNWHGFIRNGSIVSA